MSRRNSRFDAALSDKHYWNAIYKGTEPYQLPRFHSYKDFLRKLLWKKLWEKIRKFYPGGSVLEVGAGGSEWLVNIAKELKPSYCAGLDYSETGCSLLREKSKARGIDIDVIQADMFSPPKYLLRKFDFVFSSGVVEHFDDLAEVLGSISKFLKPGGVLFTLIPNMSGIYGTLTKMLNREIYEIHNPHDLRSFVDGHRNADLDVVWCDYLGSFNLGVLSACFQKKNGITFWIYKQLVYISKIILLIESITKPLPATKVFAPYIVVVSRVPEHLTGE